ncbi:hypothetical protein [Piscinibacter sp. HJYY11]|uniref:hypothetical protein n=1 Tax=Piscinibacter sp. HJYY11 TaxID=2801333 RepID=UPI00191F3AE1|nr:hypothetical protein [Piscinibacter sp. HJYY11]MBL0727738.1 hypothetical protein [Piscinibacter sp. HJYY11]
MMDRLARILLSPANWCGLGLATVVLVLKALNLIGVAGLPLAFGGYIAGFVIGGLWLGFPKLSGPMWEDALEFSDEGDAREAMTRALAGVRGLVEYNPENRLPASLQAKALDLCKSLQSLLSQWERSQGVLSMQEGFHARHIAISYLPDALKAYLSIPPQYAASRVLHDGKTAQDIFRDTLNELETKVKQLADDLASQDAQAFLVHSRFLHDKFGKPSLAAPEIQPAAEPKNEQRP